MVILAASAERGRGKGRWRQNTLNVMCNEERHINGDSIAKYLLYKRLNGKLERKTLMIVLR